MRGTRAPCRIANKSPRLMSYVVDLAAAADKTNFAVDRRAYTAR